MTIITAHMNKVYGIDWSPKVEKELVTCAQDGLVKVCIIILRKVLGLLSATDLFSKYRNWSSSMEGTLYSIWKLCCEFATKE